MSCFLLRDKIVQGQLQQATAHSTLTGPVDGADYTYRDAFDVTETTYS
jgi:hypothetical protein